MHVKVITLPVPPEANAAQQEEVRATAEKVLTEAQKGEDFDKLMKQYSKADAEYSQRRSGIFAPSRP